MRHLKKGRKFGREKGQRKALLRNLAFAFFTSGRLTTTEAKAKELQPFVEKLITRAKNKNLASQRRIMKALPADIVPKIMDEVVSLTASRHGGYTRIIKLGRRKSDASAQATLELVR